MYSKEEELEHQGTLANGLVWMNKEEKNVYWDMAEFKRKVRSQIMENATLCVKYMRISPSNLLKYLFFLTSIIFIVLCKDNGITT